MKFSLPKGKFLRWLLLALGTIVLGALGSGFWDVALKPAFRTVGSWMLELLAITFKGYKDGVYQQIAAEKQWLAIQESFYTVSNTYNLLLFGSVLLLIHWLNQMKRDNKRFAERVSERLDDLSGAAKPEPSMTAEELRKHLEKHRDWAESEDRRMRRFKWALYGLLLFYVVMTVRRFEMLTRLDYVNSADNHYHQVLRTASAYLDPQEVRQVESEFAQIQNREDFARLLQRLEKLCFDHGARVPKFEAW